MTKNMTEGHPLKLIMMFALPLLLGNLFQQTYNIVDTAIVGQTLGANALAAVGATSSVQFLVLGFCIGISCGFGIPIAQAFGGNNLKRMRDYIYHSIILTIIIGVILTVGCCLLCMTIIHILQIPTEIASRSYIYLLIIFIGLPCTLLYNLCSSILRSVGDSRTPFMFLAFSACLNIILDLFCIIILKLDVAGAALATIVSQGISGILCLIYMKKRFTVLHLEKENKVIKSPMVKNMLIMGVPMGLQYSITAIGSMVMQGANNSLGATYMSAFAAAVKIKQLALCPFDALATAASTFASQNYGAKKFDRIKKSVIQTVIVGIVYGIIAGLLLIVFGRTASLLFISSKYSAVLDASAKYLCYMGYFYWVLSILNVCRQTTQGIGYSGLAIFSGVVEMIARCFVSLVFVPIAGFTAICCADQTAWIVAAIYCVFTFSYCFKKIQEE
ncbi:MATE family efflux transporter [uncultured Catenibacterium sp.]|uniref:MATE family efflux transporter n=1 Tax=uncultured Catenibacterium sp. TaxID=286142 RepID=UPI0025F1B69E|nr:MATE family efflux transporter [uncultured Catenibacterium sp.]